MPQRTSVVLVFRDPAVNEQRQRRDSRIGERHGDRRRAGATSLRNGQDLAAPRFGSAVICGRSQIERRICGSRASIFTACVRAEPASVACLWSTRREIQQLVRSDKAEQILTTRLKWSRRQRFRHGDGSLSRCSTRSRHLRRRAGSVVHQVLSASERHSNPPRRRAKWCQLTSRARPFTCASL